MGVVPLQYVVSYSSQDSTYTAENIIRNSSKGLKRPWLSAPGDRSGRVEAAFQLEKASYITHVDIGNHNSSTIEIQVCRSSSPNYVTLLPAITLMSLADIKLGTNRNTVRMFAKDKFDQKVIQEKWDRIKVTCGQPYKKDSQFGLLFLTLYGIDDFDADMDVRNNNTTAFAPDITFMKQFTAVKDNDDKTLSRGKHFVNAALSKRKQPTVRKKSHPVSRKFQNDVGMFLLAIYDDAHEPSENDFVEAFEQQSQRRLRDEELDVFHQIYTDFINENAEESRKYAPWISPPQNRHLTPVASQNGGNSTERLGLENGHFPLEYGPSTSLLYEEAQIDTINCVPTNSSIFKTETATISEITPDFDLHFNVEAKDNNRKRSSTSTISKSKKRPLDDRPTLTKIGFNRPQDFIQFDGVISTSSREGLVECPICTGLFDQTEIETHAAVCGLAVVEHEPYMCEEISRQNNDIGYFATVQCPVCNKMYDPDEIEIHTNGCLKRASTSSLKDCRI